MWKAAEVVHVVELRLARLKRLVAACLNAERVADLNAEGRWHEQVNITGCVLLDGA